MIYENCTVWPNRKRQGEWGELRFMAAALAHGFNVMRPWGDSSAYDVVLEQGSRFLRIQVKSTGTWHRRSHGRRVYNFFTGRGDGRRYRLTDVDFYILYVAPEDLFYVIPPRCALRQKGSDALPRRSWIQIRNLSRSLALTRRDKRSERSARPAVAGHGRRVALLKLPAKVHSRRRSKNVPQVRAVLWR